MPIANRIKNGLVDFLDGSDANDYDDYGDDFEADSDKASSKDGLKEVKSKNKKASKFLEREDTGNTEKSVLFKKRTDHSFTSSPGYNGNSRAAYTMSLTPKHRSTGRKREKTQSSRGPHMKRGAQHSSPRQESGGVVVKRVLSANRNKVNTLQNVILELQNENEQLKVENRDLKRSSRIQEKVIRKYDDEEAEIPFLIQKHNSEIRVLKEKLKRQKEGYERSQEEMRKKDMEVQRLRDRVKRYEELVKEKQLDDREKLQQKLSKLEDDLDKKELKVLELERVIKLGEKTRLREAREKNERYKKAVEELKRLEDTQKDLEYRFREKEKELEFQNIYSQRIAMKKKMSKVHLKQSPRTGNELNSPRRSKPPSPLPLELSEKPRERSDDHANATGEDKETSKSVDKSQVETMVSTLRKKEEELEMILEEERKRRQLEEDQRMLKEMEDRIRRKEEEIKLVEKEKEMRRREEEKLKEETRRLKEDVEREMEERKFLERMNKEKEENFEAIKRLEKEASSEVGAIQSGHDFMNRFEAEYNGRRPPPNVDGEPNSGREYHDDKELLLARLKAIDNDNADRTAGITLDQSKDSDVTNQTNSVAKAKPIFLESSRKDDGLINHPPLDFRVSDNKRRSSKEYSFKATDENLHKGLPSRPDLFGEIKDKQKESNDLLFGEYSPTVSSAGRKRASKYRRPDKKENEKEDFLFFDTKGKARNEVLDQREEDAIIGKQKEGTFGNNDEFSLRSRNRTKSLSDEERLFQVNSANKVQIKLDQSVNPTSGTKTVFGSYQPTFGSSQEKATSDPFSPDNDPFADAGPKYGRRGKAKKSATNEGVVNSDMDNTRTGIANLYEDTKRKADNIGKPAVKAVSSFADDDIEEMVLI